MPLPDISSLFPALNTAAPQDAAGLLGASNQAGAIGAGGIGTFSPSPMNMGMGAGAALTAMQQNTEGADLRNSQAALMLDQERQNVPVMDAGRRNALAQLDAEHPIIGQLVDAAKRKAVAEADTNEAAASTNKGIAKTHAVIQAAYLAESMEKDAEAHGQSPDSVWMNPANHAKVNSILSQAHTDMPDIHDQAGVLALKQAAHGGLDMLENMAKTSPQYQSAAVTAQTGQATSKYAVDTETKARRDIAQLEMDKALAVADIMAGKDIRDKLMTMPRDTQNQVRIEASVGEQGFITPSQADSWKKSYQKTLQDQKMDEVFDKKATSAANTWTQEHGDELKADAKRLGITDLSGSEVNLRGRMRDAYIDKLRDAEVQKAYDSHFPQVPVRPLKPGEQEADPIKAIKSGKFASPAGTAQANTAPPSTDSTGTLEQQRDAALAAGKDPKLVQQVYLAEKAKQTGTPAAKPKNQYSANVNAIPQ